MVLAPSIAPSLWPQTCCQFLGLGRIGRSTLKMSLFLLRKRLQSLQRRKRLTLMRTSRAGLESSDPEMLSRPSRRSIRRGCTGKAVCLMLKTPLETSSSNSRMVLKLMKKWTNLTLKDQTTGEWSWGSSPTEKWKTIPKWSSKRRGKQLKRKDWARQGCSSKKLWRFRWNNMWWRSFWRWVNQKIMVSLELKMMILWRALARSNRLRGEKKSSFLAKPFLR